MSYLQDNTISIPDRFRFRWWDNYDEQYYYDVQNLSELDCFESGTDTEYTKHGDADNFGELLKLQAKNYGVIEQCTGLRDKNGRLIFENDIVECSHGKCLVEYAFDKAVSVAGFGPVDKLVEVIGNIHENPELLRDDNKKK